LVIVTNASAASRSSDPRRHPFSDGTVIAAAS
jgi:hypothetical protein